MADDELAAFKGDEDETSDEGTVAEQQELLIFSLDDVLYGVPAHRVSTVVSWRAPTPIPQGGSRIAGVIQDAGRIIVVLRHPAGRAESPTGEAARVVVVETRRGHIGFPAATTKGVENVVAPPTSSLGDVLEGSAGALSFIEPEEVVDALLGAG